MKKMTILLGLMLISSTVFAAGSTDANPGAQKQGFAVCDISRSGRLQRFDGKSSQPAYGDESAVKSLAKILTCARGYMEKGNGDAARLLALDEILSLTRIAFSSVNQSCLTALIENCRNLLESTPKLKNTDLFDLRNSIWKNTSQQNAKFLEAMTRDEVQCSLAGSVADVALVFGFSVSVEAGKCLGINGKKYVMLRPGVDLGVGIGVAGGIYYGTDVTDRANDRSYADFEFKKFLFWGTAEASSPVQAKNITGIGSPGAGGPYQINRSYSDIQYHAVGLGAGHHGRSYRRFLVAVGTDHEALRDLFLTGNHPVPVIED